jgi:IclR family acetate operon transcriptional repressor
MMKFGSIDEVRRVTVKNHPEAKAESNSLKRGLALLHLLAQRPNGATLREITDELTLPGASVLRLARTLVELGYLSREEGTKRYFLTNSFLRLGQPRTESRGLSECAIAAMRTVRQATGETTQLCCLIDVEMVIIEQLLSVHPFKYAADLGARCPCFSCAPGKAILAFLPEDECEATINRLSFKRFTPTTIVSKRGLRDEIAVIRKVGYSLDRAEGMPGIHCVAAPILDRHGIAVAAITIAGPSSRVREDEFEVLGQIVKEGARQASSEFSR